MSPVQSSTLTTHDLSAARVPVLNYPGISPAALTFIMLVRHRLSKHDPKDPLPILLQTQLHCVVGMKCGPFDKETATAMKGHLEIISEHAKQREPISDEITSVVCDTLGSFGAKLGNSNPRKEASATEEERAALDDSPSSKPPSTKAISTPSSPASLEGSDTDMGATTVPSPGSWTGQVGTDTVMGEDSDPAPPIETLDMACVMAAIDIGDGNKTTPQHISQVAGRLTTVLESYFEIFGMALGDEITNMLHYKNKNKAGRRNSTDEKKHVRIAAEDFITLMDSNDKKISWFPANNNKRSGVLLVTGSHYREKGTNKSFTKDDTTVWTQVSCSAHQSPGSSTH